MTNLVQVWHVVQVLLSNLTVITFVLKDSINLLLYLLLHLWVEEQVMKKDGADHRG